MKVNTAACVVLCGIALWMVAGDASPGRIRLARVLSLTVMLVALTTLAEYVVGWNSGIDELLVKDSANAYNPFRGRMSPVSATAFVAIAGALTALPFRRVHSTITWAAGGAVVAGLVSLLGYLWNAAEIVTDRYLPPVAFQYGLLSGAARPPESCCARENRRGCRGQVHHARRPRDEDSRRHHRRPVAAAGGRHLYVPNHDAGGGGRGSGGAYPGSCARHWRRCMGLWRAPKWRSATTC